MGEKRQESDREALDVEVRGLTPTYNEGQPLLNTRTRGR